MTGNMLMGMVTMFVLGVAVGCLICSLEPKKPKAEVEVGPAWRVSDDMVPGARGISVYVISDPNGQKFLVVTNGRGTSMVPYVEQK
jgi:hypothetical protein